MDGSSRPANEAREAREVSLSRPRAPMPVPPDRQFSFTDFQVSNPTAPPPGDKLDAELDRTNQAVEDVIEWVSTSLNSDGSLVEPPVTEPPEDTGAVALAEDWAEVSIAWAEHMPDTIPPNILATNAITGDHWSSRWWANYAAQAVENALHGAPGAAYIGDTPPPNPQPGMFWFDSVNAQLYVWDDDGNSEQWVIATAQNSAALVSDLPPSNPTPGQLWFDSVNPQLYVWLVDPTGPGQWVVAVSAAQGPPGPPGTPEVINTQTITSVVSNTITVPAGTNYVIVQDSVHPVNTLTVGTGVVPDGTNLWMTFPNGGTFAGQFVSAHGNLTLKVLGGGWSILAKFG